MTVGQDGQEGPTGNLDERRELEDLKCLSNIRRIWLR